MDEGQEKLKKSEFLLQYSQDWFGLDIANNQKIDMVLSTEFISTYSIIFSDHSSNIVQSQLISNSSDYNDLSFVGIEEKLLGALRLSPNNIGSESPIESDFPNMENSNTYLDSDNVEHSFECFNIQIEIRGCDKPDIDKFVPHLVASGVGEVSENGIPGQITISGKNFWKEDVKDDNGDGIADDVVCGVLPVGHKVMFKKISDPSSDADPNESEWISPLPGDYLTYTDEVIVVRIPTLGLDEWGGFY